MGITENSHLVSPLLAGWQEAAHGAELGAGADVGPQAELVWEDKTLFIVS